MTKPELRSHIREQFLSTSAGELSRMSVSICRQLATHPRLQEASVIMAFYPLKDEVDLRPLFSTWTAEGKTLLLPEVISDTEMIVRRYTPSQNMTPGALGTSNPTGEEFTLLEHIDAIITPGMAFDRQGMRMGRGRGYYDRFLARARNAYKIGVCFPYQLVEHVPFNADDIPMNEVVSIF